MPHSNFSTVFRYIFSELSFLQCLCQLLFCLNFIVVIIIQRDSSWRTRARVLENQSDLLLMPNPNGFTSFTLFVTRWYSWKFCQYLVNGRKREQNKNVGMSRIRTSALSDLHLKNVCAECVVVKWWGLHFNMMFAI